MTWSSVLIPALADTVLGKVNKAVENNELVSDIAQVISALSFKPKTSGVEFRGIFVLINSSCSLYVPSGGTG